MLIANQFVFCCFFFFFHKIVYDLFLSITIVAAEIKKHYHQFYGPAYT